jgi:hypothetical protein
LISNKYILLVFRIFTFRVWHADFISTNISSRNVFFLLLNKSNAWNITLINIESFDWYKSK